MLFKEGYSVVGYLGVLLDSDNYMITLRQNNLSQSIIETLCILMITQLHIKLKKTPFYCLMRMVNQPMSYAIMHLL